MYQNIYILILNYCFNYLNFTDDFLVLKLLSLSKNPLNGLVPTGLSSIVQGFFKHS